MLNRSRAHRILGWAFLSLLLLFMYIPVFMVILYSFNASRIGSVWTGFTFSWYGELFRRRDLWEGLNNSVFVASVASTLSTALGLCAALGLPRWRSQTRITAQGLLALPLVVPDMIMAVSLAMLFHAAGVRLGKTTIVLSHVAFGLSYAYVVIAAAVSDFDESLIAAALDCGATPWGAFRRVTVPILMPSLVVAWLLVFALSFDDFLIAFFTKGPGSDTLPIKIYSQMRFGVRPSTNALFTLLFALTVTGAGLAGRVSRRGRLDGNHN